jgi:hypothetical protein
MSHRLEGKSYLCLHVIDVESRVETSGVRFSIEVIRLFSLPTCRNSFWGPASLLLNGHQTSFLVAEMSWTRSYSPIIDDGRRLECVELYCHAPYTYFHLFVCRLFNKAVSVLDDIALIGRMIVNDELERVWRETIVV